MPISPPHCLPDASRGDERIRCGTAVNRERFYFVSAEEIEAVLEKCPDAEWRAIFALARYAGLRTPSEVLLLRWADIHWDKQRFTAHSPKTAHQGKHSRVIPLPPRLSTSPATPSRSQEGLPPLRYARLAPMILAISST